jgi:hypothetical protein
MGVASLELDNLVALNNLRTSEIWPDNRGDLWWKWPYKRGTTVYCSFNVSFYTICFH